MADSLEWQGRSGIIDVVNSTLFDGQVMLLGKH